MKLTLQTTIILVVLFAFSFAGGKPLNNGRFLTNPNTYSKSCRQSIKIAVSDVIDDDQNSTKKKRSHKRRRKVRPAREGK